MDQAETAHHLRREVPFFAAEGGAAGEGDPLRAIDSVPSGVRGDEGRVPGILYTLRQPVEHVVPADLLPVIGSRRAVHGVFDPPAADGQLHRGRALGTEPALVDRAVGIALDLE